MDYVIQLSHIWKKFKKGEKFNSLRDLIPNLAKNVFRLSKNYPLNANRYTLSPNEFWALKDVSFQVKKGEVLGIIGQNGAGKSTILKLLSGILKPNKGNIEIRGRLSALIEVTAGFHPDLTGRENIYLNGTILGMKKKEIDKKFEEIVEFSGAREFIDTPVKRYSSGMYSRLGFSVAAHMEPDIFLVDEVLSVGDIAFQAKCSQKMRELLNSKTTIVLVSHNLPLIESLCKRVILLDKGTILKEGTPDEVIPYYQNIVYKEQEEEIKKKITHSDYHVKVKDESKVNITEVFIYDGANNQKNTFNLGEPISIRINFETKEKIENPLFILEIIRADGVLCCSSSTKDNGFSLGDIYGKGAINIDLGKINLAPGIYIAKISILDKDMLHPYAIRKKDVFKIETDEMNIYTNAVFLPNIEWKLE